MTYFGTVSSSVFFFIKKKKKRKEEEEEAGRRRIRSATNVAKGRKNSAIGGVGVLITTRTAARRRCFEPTPRHRVRMGISSCWRTIKWEVTV